MRDLQRKAKIRASLEERLPNLDYEVLEELIEITYEQDRVFYRSAVNFVGYLFFSFLLTGIVVWLCVALMDSPQLQVLASIVGCSSVVGALIIMVGYNIYSRVSRTELYLNTLHQELSRRNDI